MVASLSRRGRARASASSETPVGRGTRAARPPGRLRVALDGLTDWAVLAFAAWTLLAYIGMLTKASVVLLAALWLASLPLLALALVRLQSRGEPDVADSSPAAPRRSPAGRFRRPVVVAIGVVAGFAAAVFGTRSGYLPWAVVWAPALVAVACAVSAGMLTSEAGRATDEGGGDGGFWGDVLAVALGLAFSAMALLIFRSNPDDVFYVNRASAISELGHIPVLDVIFTREQAMRGGGAGLPVDSFSALEGALARVLGVKAVSVAYYGFPPVFTFLATWTVWRLIRSWAARRAWLCLVLGSVFWLWSGQERLMAGNFFVTRMWQGKVAFVAWLIPALYLYLTRWLGRRDALTACLILTAAFCTIGATGSATFVTPLIFLAALVPLAVRRDWKSLPVPLVGAAIPLGIGIGVLLRFPLSKNVGDRALQGEDWFYHQMFGLGAVCGVATLAFWATPWLVRAGPPQRLAVGLAIVVVVVLAPGVILALSDISNLTTTLVRVLWVVPFPVVVGLLAAVPLPDVVPRAAPYAAAAAVGAVLVLFGAPSWAWRNAHWQFPPTWKMEWGNTASRILEKYEGRGPILARKSLMGAFAILTAEPKAVNARSLYLDRTRNLSDARKRRLLTRFVMEREPHPSLTAVRGAMDALRVGLVCVSKTQPTLISSVQRVGPFRPSFTVGRQMCLARTPTGGEARAETGSRTGPSGSIDRRFPTGRDGGSVSF